MRRNAAAIAVVALLAAPASAVAQCPKTSVADVEDEVMCPVCGTPLALAEEAPQAKRERAFIARQVEQCRSKEQIKAALVAEFGEEVLADPEGEGFDLAAYLVPALALLLAACAVGLGVARWRRRTGPAGPAPPPADAEQRRRLEAELERHGR